MEKYLIHSNELHLIDQERIHQAVEQMVESLDMVPDLHSVLTFTKWWKPISRIWINGER